MTETKRKKGESFEAFMRRFKKVVLQSGRLIQARKNRYVQPKVSDNKRKRLAGRRQKISDKVEYMKRIGKYQDGARRRRR